MNAIVVSKLTKDYKNGKGIFALDFAIAKGECFGYLGPNGAGKTTTIRHLLGFLNARSGFCTINGLDCRRDSEKIQRVLGYLPGEISFFDDMTGVEFLTFIANMKCMTSCARIEELSQFFGLDPSGKIRKMSKGTKQKIGLICAFMHDPDVLILDEPTSGLDPLMKNKFIELILREKAVGKTIFMSSHSFEEVEKTCDSVVMIRDGRLVSHDTIDNLRLSSRKVYSVSFDQESQAKTFASEQVDVISIKGHTVNVAVSGDIKPFITMLNRHPITGIDSVSQSLEEIFMGYYGGDSFDK